MIGSARTRTDLAGPDGFGRTLDLVTAGWVFAGRAALGLVAVALVGYLAVRPFVAIAGSDANPNTNWSELSAWPTLIGNTLIVGFGASVVSLVPALPLGYLLFRTDMPLRRAVTAVLLLAACVPLFVSASAVLSVIGFRVWQGHALIAGAVHGWAALPLSVLIVGQGYRLVDARETDAALLDAPPHRVWMHVDWPLVRWSVLAVFLVVLWLSSTDITITDLVSVRTFAEEVYITFQLGGGAAWQSLVAVPYFGAFGLLLWAAMRAAGTTGLDASKLECVTPRTTWLGSIGKVGCLLAALALIGAAVVPPVLRLARAVGGLSDFARFSHGLAPEFVTSFLLAAGCAVLVVLLVMAVGPSIVRWPSRSADRALRWSALALLALPTPLLATALIEGFNRPGVLGAIYDSAAFPLIGQVVRWLPLGLLVAGPGFLRVTRDLTDAARLDGCSEPQLRRFLYWPVSSKFLALCAVVTIVLTLGEVTASVMLSPPGFLPLSVRFFTLAHYGLHGEAAAICLLMMIVLVIPWSVLILLLHRSD